MRSVEQRTGGGFWGLRSKQQGSARFSQVMLEVSIGHVNSKSYTNIYVCTFVEVTVVLSTPYRHEDV